MDLMEWLGLNRDEELAEFVLEIVKVKFFPHILALYCQATDKIVRFCNDD